MEGLGSQYSSFALTTMHIWMGRPHPGDYGNGVDWSGGPSTRALTTPEAAD